jgi:hypothetical protein
MSTTSDFIFANSNQSFFGDSSPFGDPRDAFINGAVRTRETGVSSGGSQTSLSNNLMVGGFGNDYLTAYNWTSNEVDILVGGGGSDTFVAGNGNGSHYLGEAVAIVNDYNFYEGDVVQLSSWGAEGYTYRQDNFGQGNATLDTAIYYNNDMVMLLVDTNQFSYVM